MSGRNTFRAEKATRRPLLWALEPRFMFDGAAVADAADTVSTDRDTSTDAGTGADHTSSVAAVEVRAADPSQTNGKREVAFIDTSVAGWESLVDGVKAGVEVRLIDSTQSGLAQMAEWAETHSNYDTIHILSHGAAGEITLGTDVLSTATVGQVSAIQSLFALGKSLDADGDILIYGCDVAASSEGTTLLDTMATITGADIAASDDLTGATEAGGDWQLEASIGSLESSTLSIDSYSSVLATTGTTLLKDIYSGTTDSSIVGLVELNGELFFGADDGVNGLELWKTDGTTAGTVLVKDIASGASGSGIKNMAVVNGALYFAADSTGSGNTQLWTSDGTTAGTVLLKTIDATTDANPNAFTLSNGNIFFVATTTTYGRELWKTDGTTAGTVMVKDIYSGSSNSSLGNFYDYNGTLYFAADDGYYGIELWKSDGTEAGTVMVKDIYTYGNSHSYPGGFFELNGNLYFTAYEGSSGREVYITDGTSAGTYLAAGNAFNNYPSQFVAMGNAAYARASGFSGEGVELWKFDGTSMSLVKDIVSGSGSSTPRYLTVFGGNLYFYAETSSTGYELYKSDGTTAGTVFVDDVNYGTADAIDTSLVNAYMYEYGGKLYFAATSATYGNEIWVTDGTAAGTSRITDVNDGTASANPTNITFLNGKMIFIGTSATTGAELWVSDMAVPNTDTVISGTAANQAVNDSGTINPFSAVTLSDADTNDRVTVTVTMSTQSNGAFTAASLTASGFTDNGDGSYTLALSSVSAATTALRALVFDPTNNTRALGTTETTSFTLTVFDETTTVTNTTTSVISTSVNNAPSLSGNMTFTNGTEDLGATAALTISSLQGQVTLTDGDVGASFGGFAIVGNTADASTEGVWQYATDGGVNWYSVGTVGDNSTALALSASTRLRFVPAANYNGTVSLSIRALDNTYTAGWTSGSSRVTVDTTTNGGTTAIDGTARTASVTVNAVNDAPSLSGNMTLASVNEDNTSGVGTTISSLASQVTLTDPDSGSSFAGFAIVGNAANASTEGVWQYTTDGTTWYGVGTVSDTSALHLAASAKLRFVPVADYNGSPGALSVRAVDNTYSSGWTNGSSRVTSSVASNGGTTAYAGTSRSMSTSITAVNDAPSLSGNMSLSSVNEDNTSGVGAAISSLASQVTLTDPDSGSSLGGFAIIGNAANASTEGVWQYTTDGTTWYDVGTVSDTSALHLAASAKLRFVPVADYNGSPGALSVRAVDNTYSSGWTSGSSRVTSSVASNGGTTAYAGTSRSMSTSITAVNDAPSLSANMSLSTIAEGATNPTGSTITSLVGQVTLTDVDAGSSLGGFAITGNTANAATEGVWQYSTDGTNWFAVGTVSDNSTALALSAATQLRFVPISSFVGTPTALTVRALDNGYSGGWTSGNSRTTVDTSTNGGVTAIAATARSVTATVSNVNDAPSLSGNMTLTAVTEDATTAAGATITSLVGQVTLTDADAGSSLGGFAIVGNTANATTEGVWQYTTDGTAWFAVGAVGDGTNALALAAATRLRFIPVADYNGTPAGLSVRALDNTYSGGYTTGTNRITVDTSTNGGITAIAATARSVTTSVTGVNDAPSLSGNMTLTAVNEDTTHAAGATISSLAEQVTLTDIDAGSSLGGFAIVGNSANPTTEGVWQYTTDGTTWFAVGAVGDGTNALALSAATRLRFIPVADYNGTPAGLSVRALDDSHNGGYSLGSNRVTVDTTTNGGTTAIAVTARSVTTSVTAVNDAPSLSGNMTLTAVNEDTTNAAGATISSLVGQVTLTDIDAGSSLGGFAIVGNSANPTTEGVWQYTTDGTTWFAVGAVGDGTNALALSAATRLRFIPVADYNGTPAGLSVRALDDSHNGGYSLGSNRVTVDTTTNGGTTAIAVTARSVTTSVTAVNDAPSLSGNMTLAAVAEDTSATTGALISSLVGQVTVTDVDAGSSLAGLAIVGNGANPTTEGVWQYSTDGTTWFAVGGVGDGANALALSASTSLRFIPAANYNGQPPALGVRALDDSYSGGWTNGATRATVSTATNGGTTATAATVRTVGTSITPVNDDPVAAGGPLQADWNTSGDDFVIPLAAFQDVDGGLQSSWSVSGEPSWMSFDPQTRTLSGIPPVGNVGQVAITITFRDGSGGVATRVLEVSWNSPTPAVGQGADGTQGAGPAPAAPPAADTPAAAPPVTIVRQNAAADTGATAAANAAAAANQAAAQAAATPAAATGETAGNADGANADGGAATAGTAAADGADAAATPAAATTFQVSAMAGTETTQGQSLITMRPEAQVDTDGTLVRFTVPSDIFASNQPDLGVQLEATQPDGQPLPGWLSFNAETGTFVGQPPPGLGGQFAVRLVARDQIGGEAAAIIRINLDGAPTEAPAPAAAPAPAPADEAGEAPQAGDSTGEPAEQQGASVVDPLDPSLKVAESGVVKVFTGRPTLQDEIRAANRLSGARQAQLLAAARSVARSA